MTGSDGNPNQTSGLSGNRSSQTRRWTKRCITKSNRIREPASIRCRCPPLLDVDRIYEQLFNYRRPYTTVYMMLIRARHAGRKAVMAEEEA